MSSALAGLGERMAEIVNGTVDAFRDITLELPGARTPEDVAGAFLRGDRKLYVGIALLAVAALAILLQAR